MLGLCCVGKIWNVNSESFHVYCFVSALQLLFILYMKTLASMFLTLVDTGHFHQVAQIRIMNRDPPFHVIYLAVGANLDLPISYFDASGIDDQIIHLTFY